MLKLKLHQTRPALCPPESPPVQRGSVKAASRGAPRRLCHRATSAALGHHGCGLCPPTRCRSPKHWCGCIWRWGLPGGTQVKRGLQGRAVIPQGRGLIRRERDARAPSLCHVAAGAGCRHSQGAGAASALARTSGLQDRERGGLWASQALEPRRSTQAEGQNRPSTQPQAKCDSSLAKQGHGRRRPRRPPTQSLLPPSRTLLLSLQLCSPLGLPRV